MRRARPPRRQLLWLLLLFGCRRGDESNGLQCISTAAIDPLKEQPRYDAYAANPYFADGRSMRPPPPGTVARDLPLPSSPMSTGIADGRPLTEFPFRITPELLGEGRTQFDITCAACHGILGDGSSVVAAQMAERPPPSLLTDRVRSLPVGRIFQIATEGYGFMPSYRGQIPARLRWGVVAYVRALQLSQTAPLSAVPPTIRKRLLEEAR